jgi:hypothetical protein
MVDVRFFGVMFIVGPFAVEPVCQPEDGKTPTVLPHREIRVSARTVLASMNWIS